MRHLQRLIDYCIDVGYTYVRLVPDIPVRYYQLQVISVLIIAKLMSVPFDNFLIFDKAFFDLTFGVLTAIIFFSKTEHLLVLFYIYTGIEFATAILMLDFVNEQMMLSALIATIGKYFVALLSAKSARRMLRYSVVGFNPAASTLPQIISAVAVSTFVAIGGLTIVRFGLYWWQRDTLYSSFYWYTDSTIPKVELAWFWQTGLSLYTSFIPIAFWALSVFVGRATLGRDVSFSKYNVYDATFLGVSLVLYIPLVYLKTMLG